MKDPTDIKALGKFSEELGKCSAAVSRCLIQGIWECEPVTKKPNTEWLEDEIADVLANIAIVLDRFSLDSGRVFTRAEKKLAYIKAWHGMSEAPQ